MGALDSKLGRFTARRVSESSSTVVEVSCVGAVVVVGNQHFSVLVCPETVKVNQDAGNSVALATVHQVLEGDLIGVFGLHHVEDLILRREGSLGSDRISTAITFFITAFYMVP